MRDGISSFSANIQMTVFAIEWTRAVGVIGDFAICAAVGCCIVVYVTNFMF